jgi:beta-xylosidase
VVAWSVVGAVLATGLAAVSLGLGSGRADADAHAAHGHPAVHFPTHSPTHFPTEMASFLDPGASPPPTPTPAWPGTLVSGGAEQSDPFLTTADDRYLLFTSGTGGPAPMNVPVATSGDFVHWTPPAEALPDLPAWAEPGFTWAPDMHRFGSVYALYFTAMLAGRTPTTECIGSAFSDSPTGPYLASPTPFICQVDQGGSIDPRVFVDSDGTPWMVWKSDQNIGGATTPTKMWSQRLSGDGTTLLGTPSFLLSPDEPWQGTIVEAPDMVEVGGTYWVVYSGNWFNQPAYAIGAARCAGPAGPCHDTSPEPLLASNFQGQGPGEASVFHDAAGYWLLYSPWRSLAPYAIDPPRPVYVTRIGFGPSGPYLAGGPPPSAADLLAEPIWLPTP